MFCAWAAESRGESRAASVDRPAEGNAQSAKRQLSMDQSSSTDHSWKVRNTTASIVASHKRTLSRVRSRGTVHDSGRGAAPLRPPSLGSSTTWRFVAAARRPFCRALALRSSGRARRALLLARYARRGGQVTVTPSALRSDRRRVARAAPAERRTRVALGAPTCGRQCSVLGRSPQDRARSEARVSAQRRDSQVRAADPSRMSATEDAAGAAVRIGRESERSAAETGCSRQPALRSVSTE